MKGRILFMSRLFDAIPTSLYPVIVDYAKVLIPSIITYLITRYSLSKPRKYAIKEKQFEFVYLPLYLLTQQYFSIEGSYNPSNISMYIKKFDKIIYKHFPYVYPKTIKLFTKLKKNKSYPNLFALQNQISFDYEKLKRELGYPSRSLIDMFYRLTPIDKVIYTTYLIFVLSDFYALISSVILFINGDFFNSICAFLMFGIIAFLLYLFGYIKMH